MGYYDKEWVSDRHVLDIVKRQDVTAQLSALDDEIEAVCIARGGYSGRRGRTRKKRYAQALRGVLALLHNIARLLGIVRFRYRNDVGYLQG